MIPPLPVPSFARYVAIGDSSTEGLDDPDGTGSFRGWANRLAEHIARVQGEVLYANLAVRGRRTREVREQQFERALAMRPDLATVFSGTNDIVRKQVDLAAVLSDLEAMQRGFREIGATVVTITMPDLSAVMPMARRFSPVLAEFNEGVRALSTRTGAIVVDLARYPVTTDPRMWSEDRLHANSLGHERIAAAIAHRLGLPGADDSWSHPLDPMSPRSFVARKAADVRWTTRHLTPWLLRRLLGRSSGDGIHPKRPELHPLTADRTVPQTR